MDDDEQVTPRQDIGYRMDPEVRADLERRERPGRPGTDDAGFGRLLAGTPPPAPTPSRTTCSVCGHLVRPHYRVCPQCEGRRNRRKQDALAEVIRELKTGRANPERERHLVKQLHELDHPDPKGLLGHLEAQRSRGAGGGRSKL